MGRLCREHEHAAPAPTIGALVLRLLPDAVLTSGTWDGAAADIKALTRRRRGGEWLAVIAGAWVERIFRDGPAAARDIDLFAAIDGWLEEAIGRDRARPRAERPQTTARAGDLRPPRTLDQSRLGEYQGQLGIQSPLGAQLLLANWRLRDYAEWSQ